MSRIERPFIGAYWSARRETRRECAARILKFLHSLSDDPLFVRWYQTGRGLNVAKIPIEITIDSIGSRLSEQFTDIPKKSMPELGYSFDVWNGNEEISARFRVTCGAYSSVIGNSAVLSLPRQEPPCDQPAIRRFHALLSAAVEAWDPEVAVATSSELNARGSGTVVENPAWIKYRRGSGVILEIRQ
jgi:hypothetical protein